MAPGRLAALVAAQQGAASRAVRVQLRVDAAGRSTTALAAMHWQGNHPPPSIIPPRHGMAQPLPVPSAKPIFPGATLSLVPILSRTPPSPSQVKSLLLDFFRGRVVEAVNLAGLDRVVLVGAAGACQGTLLGHVAGFVWGQAVLDSGHARGRGRGHDVGCLPAASLTFSFFLSIPQITLHPETKQVLLRQYAIKLKRSGTRVPRTELIEMGPALDLVIRRSRQVREVHGRIGSIVNVWLWWALFGGVEVGSEGGGTQEWHRECRECRAWAGDNWGQAAQGLGSRPTDRRRRVEYSPQGLQMAMVLCPPCALPPAPSFLPLRRRQIWRRRPCVSPRWRKRRWVVLSPGHSLLLPSCHCGVWQDGKVAQGFACAAPLQLWLFARQRLCCGYRRARVRRAGGSACSIPPSWPFYPAFCEPFLSSHFVTGAERAKVLMHCAFHLALRMMQEKNVGTDALEGKVGRIYMPKQVG